MTRRERRERRSGDSSNSHRRNTNQHKSRDTGSQPPAKRRKRSERQDVFIIYSSRQRTQAEVLQTSFRRKNLVAFLHEQHSGDEESAQNLETLEWLLKSSRYIVAILSKEFLTQPLPCAELQYAGKKNKAVREKFQSENVSLLCPIFLDLTRKEFKRARKQGGKMLPALHREEEFTNRYCIEDFSNSSTMDDSDSWAALCSQVVEDIEKRDEDSDAKNLWSDFVENDFDESQSRQAQHAAFPSPAGIYQLPREQTGCCSMDFWVKTKKTRKSPPLRDAEPESKRQRLLDEQERQRRNPRAAAPAASLVTLELSDDPSALRDMARSILLQFVEKFEKDDYQQSLNRLHQDFAAYSDGQGYEKWAISFYTILRANPNETRVFGLNKDRKSCLQLLYDIVDRWDQWVNEENFPSEVFENAMVEQFLPRRFERVLSVCLVLDWAQCLYAMYNATKDDRYGMPWYCALHLLPDTDFAKNHPQRWKNFKRYLTHYNGYRGDGGSTMNKRLFRILFLEGLGLQKSAYFRELSMPTERPSDAARVAVKTGNIDSESSAFDINGPTVNFLRELQVIIAGPSAVGKTSLVRCLLDEPFVSTHSPTDGIEIRRKNADESDALSFALWDFGGDSQQMNSLYFRSSCIYLLVLDMRLDKNDGSESRRSSTVETMLEGAHQWMNDIVSFADKEIRLLIVGTHASSLGSEEAATKRLEELVTMLLSRVSQVIECERLLDSAPRIVVDNNMGTGLAHLKNILANMGRDLVEAKGGVPLSWMRLSELIESWPLETNHFCLPTSLLCEQAKAVGISSAEEMTEALHYLNNAGKVLFVNKNGLENWFFPRPTRLMAVVKSLLVERPKGLSRSVRNELELESRIDNEGLQDLWDAHEFQNKLELRNVLAAFGVIFDFQDSVVVPSRLPDKMNVPWHCEKNELEIATETRLTTDAPLSLFPFVLSRMHREHGVDNQRIGLISSSTATLLLRDSEMEHGGELTVYRMLLTKNVLEHSIHIRLRGRLADSKQAIPPGLLGEKCLTIVKSLHNTIQERFGDLAFATFTRTQKLCHGEAHEWCLLKSTKNSSLALQPCSSYTCKYAVCHSIADAVSEPANSGEFTQKAIQEPSGLTDLPALAYSEVSALVDGYAVRSLDSTYITKLESAEKMLVKWLTSVATREVNSNYTPTETEVDWIKLTARLYHILVPLWQEKFSNTDDLDKSVVFVAHTGSDKDDYAAPLTSYLKSKGVDAFLDRQSLRPGCDPESSMLQALVSCKHLWCVLSRDFVQKWFPMRELLIGYTRQQQEERSHFCIIIDCLEKGNAPAGWMERILHMETLKMYDMRGRSFPVPTMVPHLPSETNEQRHARIAKTRLANGERIVDLAMAEELICPITRERMEDPVIVMESGCTYDRKALCQSLLSRPNLDPLTGRRYDRKLKYTENVKVRQILMATFGDKAYVPFDDTAFKREYSQRRIDSEMDDSEDENDTNARRVANARNRRVGYVGRWQIDDDLGLDPSLW